MMAYRQKSKLPGVTRGLTRTKGDYMTIIHFLGYFILSIPFIVIGILVIREMGIKGFLVTFGGTALVVGLVYLGVYLTSL